MADTEPKKMSPVARAVLDFKEEALQAKRDRMDINEENFNMFNLKQDFSHKRKGQSTEFLAKVTTAVEQTSSFLQQGLVDQDRWFSIEPMPGVRQEQMKIQPEEQEKILMDHLDSNDFDVFVGDAVKLGLLGSLMIAKVSGKTKTVLNDISVVKNENDEEEVQRTFRDVWRLKLSLVRHEDYFPDPTGDGMFEIERIQVPKHKLLAMAKKKPDIFDVEAVKNLGPSDGEEDQRFRKARETNQNPTFVSQRQTVTLFEFWGDLVDPTTGEITHKNIQTVVTESGVVIMPPRKNTFWHQESPYVVSPIVRVPKSVWHRALMDAPVKHNKALNETYNLQLDSAMMAIHGIKQVREGWLEDPSQIDEGIAPGDTLLVNDSAPAGAKVLERVDTTNPSPETTNMFVATERELNQAAITNDFRVGGMPQRQVKATEIVASSNSINSIFNSITKNIETKFVKKLLKKSWLTIAQHISQLDIEVLGDTVGKARALELSKLTKAEVFADTARGRKFSVFGLSNTLNKMNDFRKITILLQTIGSNPQFAAEFQRRFSMAKLFEEILQSLDINKDKIKASPEEALRGEQLANAVNQNAQAALQEGAAQNTQTPQASATKEENVLEIPRGDVQRGTGERNS